MQLEGKVALVTGSTRGIGATIAKRFAAQGAAVAIVGRNQARGDAVVEAITDQGGRAIFLKSDIAIETDVEQAVTAVDREFGRLDVLVNNAAATDGMTDTTRPLDQYSTAEFDYAVKVALYGTFWCCKYALPLMVRAGSGSVINISSAASVEGFPGVPAYSAAKAGVNGLTRSIAADYGPHGIRANVIVLGVVKNELTEQMWADPDMANAQLNCQLIRRIGTSDDVARLALLLAADGSEYLTAQELRLDGGMSLKGPMQVEMIKIASAAADR
jgi:NAD(P)-dependent dehydrogenase (short-subunit alcohol dehydrogenase family)